MKTGKINEGGAGEGGLKKGISLGGQKEAVQ